MDESTLSEDARRQLSEAIALEQRTLQSQIESLQQRFDDIVSSAELTSTDDEHDPEGATIAYDRAQVAALLRLAQLMHVAATGRAARRAAPMSWPQRSHRP